MIALPWCTVVSQRSGCSPALPYSLPDTVAGSERIGMRVQGDPVTVNNGVFLFVVDHLGSTSVTLDQWGAKLGEMKYTRFGEMRSGYPIGNVPAD